MLKVIKTMNEKLFKAMIAIDAINDSKGQDILKEQMNIAIGSIKLIRKYAIEYNQLNEQWFLDFMDEINKLSIDPEQ